MIVLNSKRAVHDLIDKRSAIYPSRPQDEQYHIALKGENIANMDPDSSWRTQRKITARFFAPIKLDADLAKISEAEYVPPCKNHARNCVTKFLLNRESRVCNADSRTGLLL
jgi:hypothetical protein